MIKPNANVIKEENALQVFDDAIGMHLWCHLFVNPVLRPDRVIIHRLSRLMPIKSVPPRSTMAALLKYTGSRELNSLGACNALIFSYTCTTT